MQKVAVKENVERIRKNEIIKTNKLRQATCIKNINYKRLNTKKVNLIGNKVQEYIKVIRKKFKYVKVNNQS